MNNKPTAGAWRAANLIDNGIGGSMAGYRPPTREEMATTIDRETNALGLIVAIKNLLTADTPEDKLKAERWAMEALLKSEAK